ncbi:unnamed protein product [Rotaria sordida]|uniref:Uncharacterized protein n=1 Tax=Rotaria sordida TaxID=392033 RepID=A0A819Y976_9BILA|nr:unnamed protein product [Rotaria sordida]
MPKKGRTNINLTPNGWDHSERWTNLSKRELTNLISVMYYRAGITDQKGESDTNKKRAKEIIAKLEISGDKK